MDNALPLKAMHLPDSTGLWPLAAGWWLLLALLLTALAYGLWRARRSRRNYRTLALRQFDALAARTLAPQPLAAALNGLLKQVVLLHSPGQAGLTGAAWLEFLNRQSPEPLSEHCTLLLSQQAYTNRALLDADQLAKAVAEVRHWLQQHHWEADHADA